MRQEGRVIRLFRTRLFDDFPDDFPETFFLDFLELEPERGTRLAEVKSAVGERDFDSKLIEALFEATVEFAQKFPRKRTIPL